jgi:hypothetical protein
MHAPAHLKRTGVGAMSNGGWLGAATVVIMAVLGHAPFPAPAAGAVLWPAPNFIIKDVSGPTPNLSGLRLQYSARAQALGDFPFVDVDFQGDTQTLLLSQGGWQESILRGAGVAATVTRAFVPGVGQNITIDGAADLTGRTSVEQLAGATNARVANGQATANAQMTLEFQDVIQITKAGHLGINWHVEGELDGVQHPTLPTAFAASSAVAELYVWPFPSVPNTGQSFPFEWFARMTFQPGQDSTAIGSIGEKFNKPPGSRWWVYGRLTVQSNADALNAPLLGLIPPNSLETGASFGNSARLFIDPDPETPDAAFISNSGHSYATPVPEPCSLAIFAGGALAILARRRRRNHPLKPARLGGR